MSNITSTAEISAGVNVFFSKVMLARARPATVFSDFAQIKDLPSRSSDTLKFRRQAALDTATVDLAVYKSSLIDLEAYGESYGDRAQAEQYALAA